MKNSMKTERALDILCLAASYGILMLLPQNTSLLFYLIDRSDSTRQNSA